MKPVIQNPSNPNPVASKDKSYLSDPGNTSYNSVAEKDDVSKEESADVHDNAGLNTDGESEPWGSDLDLY